MTASDTEFIRSAMPLCATLEVEADTVSPERVVLRLDWRPELCTAGGLLHGGVDDGAGRLRRRGVRLREPPGGRGGTATIESKTNFLGAVGGTVRGARPRRSTSARRRS